MRADWTGSGAFTSGSTAHPRGATRQASGCAATTSTTSAEPSHGCRWRNRGTGDLTTHGFRASFPANVSWRFGAALRCQRGGDEQRSEEHTSELQSRPHLVCRLLLEKKKTYPEPLSNTILPLG